MKVPTALILAGDAYHDAEDAFTGVGGALAAEGMAVETTSDYAGFHRLLVGKSLLVILRDGIEFPNGRDADPVRWMQPDQEEAVERFVLSGGGFLALHNAGWNYPWQGPYRRTLGGYYLTHPPMARFHVEIVNPSHPITQGVSSFDIVDEQHWLYFDYDRVEVLSVSQAEDGRQSVAGWAYEYGEGRVAYLGNGHTVDILRHPMVTRLMRQAARWLVSKG